MKGDSEGKRAVSPVIGVILMVAITVTLAAVVGTFVLGLGDQVTQTSPRVTVGVVGTDAASGAEQVTLRHGGGNDLAAADLRLVVESDGGDSFTLTGSGGATLSAAERFTIDTDDAEISDGWGSGNWDSSGTGFDIAPGDTVTVTFVHEPSGQIVAEKTVRV
jgi:flagellin-like protein